MSKAIYLAGPMTGYPQFNFPLFHKAAAQLRGDGWNICSPAELDSPEDNAAAMASPDGAPGSTDTTWGEFLSRDVKLIADECSGIILLPKWEKSRGARLETWVAINCGYPVYFYSEGSPTKVNVSYVIARMSAEIHSIERAQHA